MLLGRNSICCVLAIFLSALAAGAEPKISLTVSGSTEEIRAILDFIDTLNQGTIHIDAEDPLKVRVHSVGGDISTFTPGEDGAPEIAPPPLALIEAAVSPEYVAPGEALVAKVRVVDRDRVVDTLALTVAGTTFTTDLFDNGRGGDEIGADGVWTARFAVPFDLAEGDHTLAITAYGMSGTPLRVPGDGDNPTTLTVKLPVKVIKQPR